MSSSPSFEATYARLPERFFARLSPTPVRAPRLLRLNEALARRLGFDRGALSSPDGVALLAGNAVPHGAEPIAMAYAGFQFGNWVPQLGDGRAILLGERVGDDGVRRDVQLKGSGPTPFSRRGDGRAAVGPVLREYVVSEAMAALGIPTTRSLAVVATGETIMREQPEPGAVLTRVAESHVRVGTFQLFAGRRDEEGLRALADYVIERHFPAAAERAHPYAAMFETVMERQAELVARWQGIGFIHGVMNTDNTSIVGETIDYGPCAFMDTFHPDTVYSSIDRMGRYAYGNQPGIAQWNLMSFANALLPLLGDVEEEAVGRARAVLDQYPERFECAYRAVFDRKLGLRGRRPGDDALTDDLLSVMAEQKADFTLTFRGLGELLEEATADADAVRSLFDDPVAFDAWYARWRARIAEEGHTPVEIRREMDTVNPAYIPRNHRVEEVIRAAVDRDDLAPFEALLSVLSNPYEAQPGMERYEAPPGPEEIVHATFCGT